MLKILIQEDNGGVHWQVWRGDEFIAEGIADTEVAALAAITNDLIGMNEIAA